MRRRAVGLSIVAGLGALAYACKGSSTSPNGNPAIGLADTTTTFTAALAAANPAPQPIAVTNGGSGSLTGLTVGTITYTGGQSGWLAATLAAATAPTTLTLTATTGILAAGTYTARVPVSASGASNTPKDVGVTLVVTGASSSTTLSAAGQSAVFLSAPSFATQLTLQAGAQYLVAVVNTDSTYAVTENFTLAGALTSGGASSVQSPPAVAGHAPAVRQRVTRYVGGTGPRTPTYSLSTRDAANIATLERLERNHVKILDMNRQVYARFGNPRDVRARMQAAIQAAGGRIAPRNVTVTQTIGAVNKIYVKKQFNGACTDVDSIGARTVAVGQHVVVIADTSLTTWPDSLRPDSTYYQTFVTEYDQLTWPHILTNIGNPLAYDGSLSGVGKVTVVITPVLNTFGGGIVAFVNGCDFFPFAAAGPNADFSNNTEAFYSWIPGTNGFDVPTWEKLLRSVAAHETKHLVSYTDRIIDDSPVFEEIWLEEGLAQESSEIWERHFNEATWKGHANFLQTIGCEFNLGASAPCDAAGTNPVALSVGHLPFFFAYLQNESQSNSEGLGQDTPSNYGAGWTISRWATDQYAAAEGTFIQSLVNEPTLNGLANLSSHTGQPIPLLLVYWNLATAIFDTSTYTAADVRTTIPSFNFGNIFFDGQTELTCSGTPCGFFTNSGLPVYPVQPIALTAGTINQTVNGVPGTAASFFLLSAPSAGTETLQLEGVGGGTISASSGFRVGIIRVK